MSLYGFTDSLANFGHEIDKCSRCGGISRLANGLCLTCLMQSGLEPADEHQKENFASLLGKIDIRDSDWRIGSYDILEEVGRGGMGVIYRARQRFSGRIVALKRVLNHNADSPETLARFRREAEAASSLDHPNILPIYEVGESEDGFPFFTMKFAPGGSLREVGRALQRAPDRIVPLMVQTARGVHSAHEHGLLHRDLKPANILLDGRGEPMVSDFGLAKWLDASSDLTRTLTVFGTPGYIAPEQAAGRADRLTPAVDVYSLGAILFDLLTGRPPFLGEHALSVISQAAEKEAPRLRSIVRSIDRDLETICARCLERDPGARYGSANDLAQDLERWLQSKPIVARPVSPPARVIRWSRRNPALATSLGICVVLAALSWPKFSEHRKYQASLLQTAQWQHSVTVLPFLDLDAASKDRDTAREVARTLSSEFSAIGPSRVTQAEDDGLAVVAAPRLNEIPTIARQAGVRKVLIGTKRQVGRDLSYSIRLVDPDSPNTILTKVIKTDPGRTDIGNHLQRDRAQLYEWIGTSSDQVAAPPVNKTSSDFIAAGRALMERRTPSDTDKAIDCFQKAVAVDPSSAQAHAFLATARIGRFFLGGRPELLQLAHTAAADAIVRDAQSGEAHWALSRVLHKEGALAEAREEAFRAIELQGVDERSTSRVAAATKILGRPDIALSWLQIMKHLQSQPALAEYLVGDCWMDLCNDERAEQAYRRTAELRPDLPEGWMGICRLRLLNKNFASALRICSENEKGFLQFDFVPQMVAQCHFFARDFAAAKKIYADLARKDPDGGGDFYGMVSYQSALGYLYRATGEDRIGKRILNRARQGELQRLATAPHHPETLYRTAAIEAALGLETAALDHLRAAEAEGWIDFRSLALDPRFDALRDEPDFKRISEAMSIKVASLQRSMLTVSK